MKGGKSARLTPMEVGRDCTEHVSSPSENFVPNRHVFVIVWQAMSPSTRRDTVG
jgi:hypothetical protein